MSNRNEITSKNSAFNNVLQVEKLVAAAASINSRQHGFKIGSRGKTLTNIKQLITKGSKETELSESVDGFKP